MKTLSEKIAVMQAAERGEAIETCVASFGREPLWLQLVAEPQWDWVNKDYRIAPKKPREFFVALYEGRIVGGGYDQDNYTVLPNIPVRDVTLIRVREAVDEPHNPVDRYVHNGSVIENKLHAPREPKPCRTGRYMRFGPHCRQLSDDKVTWWDET